MKERRAGSEQTVDLAKLSGALEAVKLHLERAEAALLVAASTRAAAPEIEESLQEVKAAAKLTTRVYNAVNEQIIAVPPKVRCGHCQAEMLAAAGRCGNCWRVTAKA